MPRNSYPWKRIIADAQAHGGWLLPPELVAVPTRVAEGIRLLRHADLIRPDGHLESRVVDPWTDEDGRRICNVWVRWSVR